MRIRGIGDRDFGKKMLTLSEKRSLARLVLGDFVRGVLLALLPLAEGVTGLGNVDLRALIGI